VILNLASVEELRKLPGIGAKRAEAIVALRERLGKFKRLSDLLRVKGIGPKRLKQLLPKLLLDAEKP
jgi:competence protein ComEA